MAANRSGGRWSRNGGALGAAIARARTTPPPTQQVFSPLGALGRRQLSQVDLIGQSLSTIAPATGMIYIAAWMISARPGLVGLAAIVGITAVVVAVAFCVTQFTRRLAAAGSLYSFAFHGLPRRATLTVGAALLLGYLGISISVLANSAVSLLGIAAALDVPLSGSGPMMVTAAMVAGLVAVIAVRGVRFATRAILVVEVCSLALICILMLAGPDAAGHPTTPPSPGTLPVLALIVVLSMAGFESAAFFGPEARRPLTTVSRAVLVTPVVCGSVFVFAAWAALTGRADAVVAAYFDGTASGVSLAMVLAVKVGVTCSWLACTLGCAQAGSRLLLAMGVEGTAPRSLSRVHPRLRTPYVAVASFLVAGIAGAWAYLRFFVQDSTAFDGFVEVALVIAYTLLAVSCLRFLRRIGEDSPSTTAMSVGMAAAGASLLGYLVVDGVAQGQWVLPVAVLLIGASGTAWAAALARLRPHSLTTMGAFDSVETADLLPGSGTLILDDDGRPQLVSAHAGPGPRE
ncbi:Amino acid transporter [Rhodococcus sp. RD6.2]|uniref:APC family permease n=1 Tax=Rhodococcus sp. RD6.2 TaxID=260936 RepID=UPI00063B86CB|nr:APC family permease [Rhodococcus sp. RD6.2]CRK53780.1 Amino acid transporter [Rhodococcus sp. RD6.2]